MNHAIGDQLPVSNKRLGTLGNLYRLPGIQGKVRHHTGTEISVGLCAIPSGVTCLPLSADGELRMWGNESEHADVRAGWGPFEPPNGSIAVRGDSVRSRR